VSTDCSPLFLFNQEQLTKIQRRFTNNLGDKMKLRILIFFLFIVSCTQLPDGTAGPDMAVTNPPAGNMPTQKPSVNQFAPRPGDGKLVRGNAFINEASLVIRESYPPQIALSIAGDLPTPCHQLRAEIAQSDAESKIMIDIYSMVNPDTMCTQVVKPFQEQIDLGTFPSGHYSVWVNGELVGEFDS
jgi:hypothetical protein